MYGQYVAVDVNKWEMQEPDEFKSLHIELNILVVWQANIEAQRVTGVLLMNRNDEFRKMLCYIYNLISIASGLWFSLIQCRPCRFLIFPSDVGYFLEQRPCFFFSSKKTQ